VNAIDLTGKDIVVIYGTGKYDPWGVEEKRSWTFNGANQNQAPNNKYVQDFLLAYNYNIENGGGDNLYKLANSREMKVKLMEGRRDTHQAGTIFWNPQWASETAEGHVYSPATALEHEMDHAVSYLTDPGSHKKRAETNDKQYDTKEERRVIMGSESKTAQANGEFPKGYVRTDHADHGSIRVSNPTKTTPMPEMPPVQQQPPSSSLKPCLKCWGIPISPRHRYMHVFSTAKSATTWQRSRER
jgi:hypothetical protein